MTELDQYSRVGYIPGNSKSDTILSRFITQLPADGYLPLHWHYINHDYFTKKYMANGEHLLWASARSSHLLFLGGFPVLRVWTDTVKACYIDLNDSLANALHDILKVEDIPVGNFKKSRPFTKRVRIWQQFQVDTIISKVRQIYGLDSKRL